MEQLIKMYEQIRANDNGELDGKFTELLEATVGSDHDVWDISDFDERLDYFEEFIMEPYLEETV